MGNPGFRKASLVMVGSGDGEGERGGKGASQRSSYWNQKVLRSCLLMLSTEAGGRVCQGAFLKTTSTELMTNCMWG